MCKIINTPVERNKTRRFSNHVSRLLLRSHTFAIIVILNLKIHQSMWIHWPFFPKTWTKGHWPLDDLWPHVCWGHMSSVECNKVVSAFLLFCGKSNFLLRFPLYFIVFLTSWFFHNNVNTLSWDLHHDPKCLFSHVLSKSGKYSISPKMSLTTFLHSHDDVWLYPRIIVSKSHDNTSMYVDTVINFAKYHIHTYYILRTEWVIT